MGTFALPMSWHSALNGAQIASGTQPISAPNLRELCQVLMLHFEKPPEQNVEHSGFFQTFLWLPKIHPIKVIVILISFTHTDYIIYIYNPDIKNYIDILYRYTRQPDTDYLQ